MKKILIVDDEQDIVESLKFVLEVSGFVCYTAFNGEDGLKLAKEIMPDLIILDVFILSLLHMYIHEVYACVYTCISSMMFVIHVSVIHSG